MEKNKDIKLNHRFLDEAGDTTFYGKVEAYPGKSFKVKVKRVFTIVPEGEILASGQLLEATDKKEEGRIPVSFEFGEDIAVGTVLWLAFAHPIAALAVLAVLVALTIWMIPKLWRFIRALLRKVTSEGAGSPPKSSPDV